MEEALDIKQTLLFDTQAVHAHFLKVGKQRKLPIAAWKLPDDNVQHIIMDVSGEVKLVDVELENMPPGFIVSAFEEDYTQVSKANYIHADLHYNSHHNEIVSNATEQHWISTVEDIKAQILHDLEDGYQLSAKPGDPEQAHTGRQEMNKDQFIKLVESAKRQIQEQRFKKVVPSRCQYVQLPEGFSIAATFQRMCKMYPHAFVSAIAMPGLGVWLGASPEILVKTFINEGKRIFSTMALAGTQKLDAENNIKNAAWRSKEIEEQAMVSRYIINCFKKIRLREFDEDGPHTVEAGNLLHLRTDFTVNMDEVNFYELGSVMLKLLHPTSAVCGLPKEPALEFIAEHEHYDRELFAGFLGPVNINDEVNVFVNLRCMQLLGKKALIYAGAGVTADSEAEKEWMETSIKMETLQKVLY
ncbi:isochorismate synthase [Catalinimonas alkaloidigena]|uniref:chorismate-binding protein n=1 Tax=Catalinimonas alkaloidigena TaxID=1075417 RepID=UPI002406B531|nr:chorismate-binding protein [Catalinimonas alkaloidigena]MDF9797423.1 isochorismate synthase [Catalinimonas alkaloidigena]